MWQYREKEEERIREKHRKNDLAFCYDLDEILYYYKSWRFFITFIERKKNTIINQPIMTFIMLCKINEWLKSTFK